MNKRRRIDMPIVRSIYVKVVPAGAKNAEQSWRRVAPPLMMHQPSCRSENSGQEKLRANDDPERFHFYSRWKDQQSIDAYLVSEAHQE
jgi:quinol monooxygenase YgiN